MLTVFISTHLQLILLIDVLCDDYINVKMSQIIVQF